MVPTTLWTPPYLQKGLESKKNPSIDRFGLHKHRLLGERLNNRLPHWPFFSIHMAHKSYDRPLRISMGPTHNTLDLMSY